MKSETRKPRSEGNPKAEIRMCVRATTRVAGGWWHPQHGAVAGVTNNTITLPLSQSNRAVFFRLSSP